jgi:hypothetical protein
MQSFISYPSPSNLEFFTIETGFNQRVSVNRQNQMSSRPAQHSNDVFWSLQERLTVSRHIEDSKVVADLKKTVTELQRNLKDAKLRLKEATKRCLASARQNKIDLESMRALNPRLCFWEPRGRLPEDLSIKIFREAGVDARFQAVQVCNVFNDVIRSGRVRGAFDVKGGSLAAGEGHTVICTAEGRVLTFGYGRNGQLGHGGNADEMVPRMVEGLMGVKVAQVAAGGSHTVICTAEGRVMGFGGNVDRSLWPKLVLEITDLGNSSEEDEGDRSESEDEDEDESEIDGA